MAGSSLIHDDSLSINSTQRSLTLNSPPVVHNKSNLLLKSASGLLETNQNNNQSVTRPSYSYFEYQRLRKLCLAVRQTEDTVKQLKADIQLKCRPKITDETILVQLRHQNISDLETQNEIFRQKLRTGKARLMKVRQEKDRHLAQVVQFRERLRELRVEIQDKVQMFVAQREQLLRHSAQMVIRQRYLIGQLRHIYPITLVQIDVNIPVKKRECACENECFTIRGVHLPNSELLQAHNERTTKAGLDFAIHLLQLIARILNVPLRYSIGHTHNAQPIIMDTANPKLLTEQRICPLNPLLATSAYWRELFEYGVYLLNRNLAQLMLHVRMGTPQLPATLHNLNQLIAFICNNNNNRSINVKMKTTKNVSESELKLKVNRTLLGVGGEHGQSVARSN